MFQLGDKVNIVGNNIEPGTIIGLRDKNVTINLIYCMYLVGFNSLVGDSCRPNQKGYVLKLKSYDLNSMDYYNIQTLPDFESYTYCCFFNEEDLTLAKSGYNCIICNQHYPYAQANLPNNKLKCYSCRNI